MKPLEKTLKDFRWIPIEGIWNDVDDALWFSGGEYDPATPAGGPAQPEGSTTDEPRDKYVNSGIVLFSEHFREGRIRAQVEFDTVDYRSFAGLIVQYNPENKDLLTFGVTGGALKPAPGVSGFLYKLQSWGVPQIGNQTQQGSTTEPPKIWTPLFQVGLGANIKPRRTYDLEVVVRGSKVVLFSDNVEIGRYTLPLPSLPGHPFGLFSLSSGNVKFRDICIETVWPKAFVVMQFQTPEYEALFCDVIEPICFSEGLQAYRADFTYMPGLVIEDIKKQIQEFRIVIAEITPENPNVYYEVGYADAINKPIILISDRKEGMKPFDVRAYRTIFYDNSIGGKNKIESDLRAYLKSIMET